MAVGGPKRHIPTPVRKVLDWDQALTKKVVDIAFAAVPSLHTSLRVYMKFLEVSCHGIPWFALTLISIYLLRSEASREIQINLLFGLVYDVMIVAFVKAIVRRSRPVQNRNDDILSVSVGPDKFSFPSGHATRAVYVTLFFTQWAYPGMSFVFRIPILVWAGAVCASRVLMRRHFILDVIAGVAIGNLEFLLSGILWIGPGASKWLGDWISTAEDEYN
ncbi:unnamed protein product [Allacma fusca]|uniref:Phosphatidic acid phosphatase type 2/haloperoxidase domain-containing protein n=1 Tax=Allacma fusca TaxID=39272 RepID=A0A8J2KYW1_9HEXA|nr:unnamed protein product [Allacma fusca]